MKEELIKPEGKVSSHLFSFKQRFMRLSRKVRLVVFIVIIVLVIGLIFLIFRNVGGPSTALSPQNELQRQFLDQLPELQDSIAKDPNNPTLQQQLGVAKSSIQKYTQGRRAIGPTGQTWGTFLRNHASEIWACDFLQTMMRFSARSLCL